MGKTIDGQTHGELSVITRGKEEVTHREPKGERVGWQITESAGTHEESFIAVYG